METIAVYWEESIKTYGIRSETGLDLVQVDVSPSSLSKLGRQLVELGRSDAAVRLILLHCHTSEILGLSMVFSAGWREHLSTFISGDAFAAVSRNFRVDSPVEMLNFHGPHFGDRYGIADAAHSALKKENIRYIAMGCSAASVHVVFPENTAEKARKALATVFKTP